MPKKITKAKSTKVKKRKNKMNKAEKGTLYHCDVCGCEVVSITPSRGPVMCCDEVMCC
jgi:ribosomal 30S subunit maturation factor RimM